ncbi:biotin-dependent carboxyltransferase family protein [Halobacillus locisalis]|uniref:Biotin-dependent carboxyltransferase family protein n=1 Tax=Halobacillus locisalis TaxID=220753 RepID=A0A838CXC5_9BACI|nr:biotin-dependent carboxyltransferase family protein [Halobacillus locisalis]MBA2176415.1 biotin-dependent carboxyltransferase family protein [Halobacillus locisalis]
MLKVMKSGLMTTIQDLGRHGYQKEGVVVSGAMDEVAHRVSNRLVGNPSSFPTLEITLMGPVIEFEEDALIALCGGDLAPLIDGHPVDSWRPIFVRKGCELRFGRLQTGFRVYMAVAGGYDIPPVMHSTSTYLRAKLGGYKGRALEDGDRLSTLSPSEEVYRVMERLRHECGDASFKEDRFRVATDFTHPVESGQTIRVTKGTEYDSFSTESVQAFETEPFTINSKSDRMGCRLIGPALTRQTDEDLISEAVAFGTIQVPTDGTPILLLADRQTTGGYPRIAQVATVDLPKVAQLKPGEDIHFELITHEQSQWLYVEREKRLQQLFVGIQSKFN